MTFGYCTLLSILGYIVCSTYKRNQLKKIKLFHIITMILKMTLKMTLKITLCLTKKSFGN